SPSGSGPRSCSSTSRPPACPARRATSSSTPSPACPPTSACSSSTTTWTWCSASPSTSPCSSTARCSPPGRRARSAPIPTCARSTSGRRAVASALTLRGVTAGYGETVVLEDIDLALAPGENVSVIGRNGVGKTTLLATIMGHTTLHRGEVWLDGQRLDRVPVFRRARRGLGWVPQEREIFPSLSVRENLAVAARPGPWTIERVFELFPGLAARLGNMGDQLSGGEQQMLA